MRYNADFNFYDFCILQERRSNPEVNKKKGILQTLKDIQAANKGKLVFGRFTEVPKIGINPSSRYTSTPRGIYAYPLDHIIKNMKGDFINVAFAGEKRYLSVFSINTDRVWNIQRGKPAPPFVADVLNAANKISTFPDKIDVKGLKVNSSKTMYNVLKNTLKPTDIAAALKQANVPCVIDYTGIIHPADPVQVWFYDASIMEPIEIIDLNPIEKNKNILKVDLVMDFIENENLFNNAGGYDSYDMELVTGIIVDNLIIALQNGIDPIQKFKAHGGIVYAYKMILETDKKLVCVAKVLQQEGEEPVGLSMILYGTKEEILYVIDKYAKGAENYHPEQFIAYVSQRNNLK